MARKKSRTTSKRRSANGGNGAETGKARSTPTARTRDTKRTHPAWSFRIVGIGASAGGLEALEAFFARVPVDCGMAFVVVTHQHPDHTSLLPELLGRRTRLPIRGKVDGAALRPNHIYVNPSKGRLAIFNGALHVMDEKDDSAPRLPIDFFFRSLAEDQKERAIGVVLSGTGTDGTLGLKAIKGAAGLTMAQEPGSAKYAGMPSSAIDNGLVDYVLPVEEMPGRLVAFARGPNLAQEEGESSGRRDDLPTAMRRILLLLRTRSGHDFSAYKANTIRRRIERRINVHQLSGPQHYARYLQENRHELDLLFKELLIGVTHFFRDPEAFDALGQEVETRLMADRPAEAPLRVWSPGCSTGEEPYSIAMLMHEKMSALKKPFRVQIFATDLDQAAIDAARIGRYPDGIAQDCPRGWLSRYLIREDHGYLVRKEIREMVVFAVQNVLKDPPFTKVDLIACRNVLIYLQPAAQERLLTVFQYALNPGGLLFLGPSESLNAMSEHFTVLDKRFKIFLSKHTELPRSVPRQVVRRDSARHEEHGADESREVSPPPRKLHLSVVIEKVLLKQFAPSGAVVNRDGDILYIHGRTGDYLEPSTGQPRLNILDMAREGLRIELAAALRRAASQKKEVVQEGVRVKTNGSFATVRLTVRQLLEPESIKGLLLATFEPQPSSRKSSAGRKTSRQSRPAPDGRIQELENELQHAREALRTTVGELETVNEDLKSANEELQSTNEELQSTNEELETSREEMQSLNEELQTVNAQLQTKVEDLAQSNDDMQNLLNSTEIATLFLDEDLRIKRFSEAATQVFNVIPSDVGRPIGDLAPKLHYETLDADAGEVLRTLVPKEREVRTRDSDWRQVRICPYRSRENFIEGLVITFVNINRVKDAEQDAQEARTYAESIIDTVREPLVVLDAYLRIVSASSAFYQTFKTSRRDVEHRHIYELGNGQWDIPQLRELLENILPENSVFEDFEVEHEFPGIGRRFMLLNARRLQRETGQSPLILLAIEDRTRWHEPQPPSAGDKPSARGRRSKRRPQKAAT